MEDVRDMSTVTSGGNKKEVYHLRVRKFLNKEGFQSTAAIHAVIQDTRSMSYGGLITLSISDCSRKIQFDFDNYEKEDRENSLAKAKLLADTLSDFYEALKIEFRRTEIRNEKREKKRKKALAIRRRLARERRAKSAQATT